MQIKTYFIMVFRNKLLTQGKLFYKHRAWFNILIIIVLLPLYLIRDNNPDSLISSSLIFETLYDISLLILSLFGLFIRIYAKGYSPKRFFFPENSGLYSLMRHPIYFSNYIIWLGMVALSFNLWFVIVYTLAYILYYERIMFAEEEFLIKKYQDKYLDYSSNTSILYPKFSNYIKPKREFDFSKVINKELDYYILIIMVFTLLNIIGNLLNANNNFNYPIIILSLISLILYLILSILKYKTDFFNPIEK